MLLLHNSVTIERYCQLHTTANMQQLRTILQKAFSCYEDAISQKFLKQSQIKQNRTYYFWPHVAKNQSIWPKIIEHFLRFCPNLLAIVKKVIGYNSTSVVNWRIPPCLSSGVLMRMSQSMTKMLPLAERMTFSSCRSLR